MRSAMLACIAALTASCCVASSSGDLHTSMCTHTHVHDCTACNMMLRMIIDTPHLHTPFSMHHPDYSVLSNMIARMQIDTPHVHMPLSIHNEYILLFSVYRSARHDLISRPAPGALQAQLLATAPPSASSAADPTWAGHSCCNLFIFGIDPRLCSSHCCVLRCLR